jgi:hypothetical protein
MTQAQNMLQPCQPQLLMLIAFWLATKTTMLHDVGCGAVASPLRAA